MRFLALILVALTTGMIAACQPPPLQYPEHSPGPHAESVPLVMLMTRPEIYDGRYVVTEGVVSTQYHEWAIFVSQEDFDQYHVLNGVSLAMEADPNDRALKALNGRHARVAGVFSEGISGHLGGSLGLLAVESIHSSPTRQQLTYWRLIEIGPLYGTPWLILLGLLVAFTAAMILITRLEPGRSARPGPIRAGLWGLLVCASLLIGWEVYLASRLLPEVLFPEAPREFLVVTLGTALFGAVGLAGMWLAWRAERQGWVLAFVALQLLFPVAREVRRTDTWEGQLRYPFHPEHVTRSWESPTWPLDPMPQAFPYEEMPLPQPAYRGDTASSALEPSAPAPQ